ncbi:hypothetical protein mvi_27070 [Methylobacterium indicum]|uniref:Uncharacterized protein n=1 Tax=Methylobacterium indicum TaxID=1775910 RepID=A0A8H9C6Z9_9HYPH|nr:hypothetical protein mvi_27070 [Methylobacterium indicum]
MTPVPQARRRSGRATVQTSYKLGRLSINDAAALIHDADHGADPITVGPSLCNDVGDE